MRLSDITTEVYGCTISVFMILASCHYVLSETQNSIPIMHWQWTINLLKLSLMNWRTYPCGYNMKSLFFFWVIPMKLLTPITFLPLGSSFNFFWDFTYIRLPCYLHYLQPTCSTYYIGLTSTSFDFYLISRLGILNRSDNHLNKPS